MHALTISIADAAKALSVSRPTIYKLIRNGSLPCIMVGHRRLVTPEALRSYVTGREKAGQ